MGEALLVCGDFRSPACGVGSSEAAWCARHPEIAVVDPLDTGAALRHLWRVRRSARAVIVAHPTCSTVKAPAAYAVHLAAAAIFRRRVRWHLHEYAVFREIRWVLDALLWLSGGCVVVSTATDAAAVRPAVRRRCDVRVVPPANGSSLSACPPAVLADPPVVGVFGRARTDKGMGLLLGWLEQLPEPFAVLETVGDGWESMPWTGAVSERYTVRHRGLVADADVGEVLARWTLAFAPFEDGATDGRMSLRTPLSAGVPTVTAVSAPDDLTLQVPHLWTDPIAGAHAALAFDGDARRDAAAQVEAFERDVRDRLDAALLPGVALG